MIFDRHWEKFEGGPSVPFNQRMHVSIDKRGVIYINRLTYLRFGKPEAVTLYYNRAQDSIGLHPSPARQAISFPLKRHLNGFVISASPFCAHFRIKISETLRFYDLNIESSGDLILDLRKTILLPHKTRKGKNQPTEFT